MKTESPIWSAMRAVVVGFLCGATFLGGLLLLVLHVHHVMIYAAYGLWVVVLVAICLYFASIRRSKDGLR